MAATYLVGRFFYAPKDSGLITKKIIQREGAYQTPVRV